MTDLDWTDNCDAGGSVAGVDGPLVGGECGGTITRTWNIMDACGNAAATRTQIITVDDTTAPVLDAAPADISVQCIEDVPAMTDLDWTDNCDAGGSVAGVDGPLVGGECGGTITRTWNIMDACGNAAITRTQIITVDDTTAPVLDAAPADISVQCIEDVPAMTDLDWTDNCDAGGSVAGVDGPLVGGECGGTITRTWNIMDACGNAAATRTQIITVDDTTAPELDPAPADVSVQCIEDVPAMTDLDWTDNCDAGGSVAGVDGPLVGGECGGTITRTWNIMDACGNAAITRTQIITVDDTTDPEIQAPDDYTICNDAFPAILYADWTDNCTDGGQISAGPTNIQTNGCIQTADYVFTATDDCDNTATETVVVTREFDQYTNCETAYARLSENNPPSQCFITDPDYNFNRWGWTNYIAEEGTYEMDLWAGAAHCDTSRGDLVGTVIVTYSGGLVDVEYNILPGYAMSEAHVNIGCGKYPTKNGRPTVAPGQYNFNLGALDHVNNYTLEDVAVTGPFWIIAHAVTCEVVCRCSISADEGGSHTSTLNPINCPENQNVTQAETVKTDWTIDYDVYPVPFNSEFYVKYNFDYDTDVTIEIYNIKGTLVEKVVNNNYVQGSNATSKIDLAGKISNEVLFIKLSTSKGLGIKKIVAANYFGNK